MIRKEALVKRFARADKKKPGKKLFCPATLFNCFIAMGGRFI